MSDILTCRPIDWNPGWLGSDKKEIEHWTSSHDPKLCYFETLQTDWAVSNRLMGAKCRGTIVAKTDMLESWVDNRKWGKIKQTNNFRCTIFAPVEISGKHFQRHFFPPPRTLTTKLVRSRGRKLCIFINTTLSIHHHRYSPLFQSTKNIFKFLLLLISSLSLSLLN